MRVRIVLGRRVRPAMRRAVWWAWWAGLAGALAGVAFVVSFFAGMQLGMRTTEVRVPDVTGGTVEAARALASDRRLVVEVVDRRHDPRLQSGLVLEQMPPPDTVVRHGRKIKLVLSLGGRVLSVPDLVGQASRAVAIELRQQGLSPGDEARVPSPDVPVGRVIAQVPSAATTAVPSSRVHRLVSDGPADPAWVMPDLSDLPRAEVERWVEHAGFRRGSVRSVAVPGRRAGTVVGQLPLAGYPIRSRDIVELVVAE